METMCTANDKRPALKRSGYTRLVEFVVLEATAVNAHVQLYVSSVDHEGICVAV